MKYFLIAGEASGDMHASRLMRALKQTDAEAEFRFFGGDLMTQEGGQRLRHYKELAYMGFIPVLLHLPTILRNMSYCKAQIAEWQPDAVILIDYPGFNLDIARFVQEHNQGLERPIKVFYYIAPKLWAWKEYRIRNIKRDVDRLFSILPFEVDFFEGKHSYPITYVGNPTADEVREFRQDYRQTREDFCREQRLNPNLPIVALLAGSRVQEIKDNLPMMIRAASKANERLPEAGRFQLVVAGAPSISHDYYDRFLRGTGVALVQNKTYELLSHSMTALVTSGTATLETCLLRVPQVVCYKTPVPHLIRFCFNHIIKCRYISLVNLIADREVVQELLADRFTEQNIISELLALTPGRPQRYDMLQEYERICQLLGDTCAPENAAREMVRLLRS